MRDECRPISAIVATIASTTPRAVCATPDALPASSLATFAFSAFCDTVAVSCAMLAALSSSDAACVSVRADRSALPAAISRVAVLADSEAAHTSRSAAATRSISALNASAVRASSSRPRTGARNVKSREPPMRSIAVCSAAMPRFSERASAKIIAQTTTMPPSITDSTVTNTESTTPRASAFCCSASAFISPAICSSACWNGSKSVW